MDGSSRRSVTSGAGAFGLVLLAVLGWWLFSGNGPQGPSGNDARYAVPDVDVDGSGAPTATPRSPAPGAIAIESYVLRDDLRLSVGYRTTPRCQAALDTPRVIESDVTVTITLTADAAGCGSGSGRYDVTVLLDSPLDGRAVLDGSRSPQVRVEPTTATDE